MQRSLFDFLHSLALFKKTIALRENCQYIGLSKQHSFISRKLIAFY